MFFGDQVEDTRKVFFESWQKYIKKLPLQPLEQQIADVIREHPEYHEFFSKTPDYMEHSYFPEMGVENPFLHLGLHLAVRDQVAMNRPQGIAEVFRELVLKQQSALHAEHLLIEQLAESLWLAQKNQCAPDEQDYLQKVRGLLRGGG